MLKYLRFLFLFIISFSLSTALTSCGGDDNDEDPNDPARLAIVGKWIGDSPAPKIMEFDKSGNMYWESRLGLNNDGLVDNSETWSYEIFEKGYGTWKYKSNERILQITLHNEEFNEYLTYNYKLDGGKLIGKDWGDVYTRISDSTSPFIGTSWQGSDDGEIKCSDLQLKFRNDGCFTEIYNGTFSPAFHVIVGKNSIMMFGFANLSKSKLLNIFENCYIQPIEFSLNPSETELTLKDDLGNRMIFTKI